MGITYQVARTILQEHKNRPISGSVLLVGRQTVSMTPPQAMALIESEGIPLRPNVPIEIDRWTVGSENHQYISDRCFFSLFADAETAAIDVSDYEQAEHIHDLNGTLPAELFGRFDFMFNGSCLDNLFDAASALKNMSRLLSGHGRILHIEHHSPIQTAYVMYSPAYFFDYYAINGFDDIRVMPCMFDEISDPWYVFDWRPFRRDGDRWTWSPHTLPQWRNTLTLVLAEKRPESTSDRTPIQGFYRGLHATEKSEYFELFERARRSPRRFRFGDLEPAITVDDDAFEFIGILASPEARALSAVNKARQAVSRGDMPSAREGFSTAIAVAPHIGYPGLVFVERGDVHQALGDDAAALVDYEQAVILNPQDATFRQRIEVLASKAPRQVPTKSGSMSSDRWLARMGRRMWWRR